MCRLDRDSSGPGPLLGQRSAVVFLLGILAGVTAGALTGVSEGWAQGVLTGAAAFVAGVMFFHTIID